MMPSGRRPRRRFWLAAFLLPLAAHAAPVQAAKSECRTDRFTFSAVNGDKVTANSVSTGGASCSYKFAPVHPDAVQFTSGSITKQPSGGTLTQVSEFTFSYQPRAGFKGSDHVAIKVCGHNSKRAGCATITYNISVE